MFEVDETVQHLLFCCVFSHEVDMVHGALFVRDEGKLWVTASYTVVSDFVL
jgi:hypothetical protein